MGDAMIQEFDCKEKACDKKGRYVYAPIPGMAAGAAESVEREAYLTCENGRRHTCTVKVPRG